MEVMLLVIPALFALYRVATAYRRPQLPYPPGPKGHWLLGNLRDMPAVEPWLRFSEWAAKYGDVTYLNVLGRPIVVLNTLDACRELLDRRGAAWSGRPVGHMHELMGMGKFMIMQQETASWRTQRRLVNRFFGQRVVGQLAAEQANHAASFIQRLHEDGSEWRTTLRRSVSKSVFAIMYGLPAGTHFSEFIHTGDLILHELVQAIVPGNYLVDVVPFLRFVPTWFPGAGFKRHARYVAAIVTHYVGWYFKEAKNAVARGDSSSSFVSRCLNERSEAKIEASDEFIQWTASSVYLAAVDTVSSLTPSVSYFQRTSAPKTDQTLANFVTAMHIHPQVQKRVQDEMDSVLGRDVLPTLADRERLPYLDAVIKETMRWRLLESIAVGLAHRTTAEQEYQGSHIPEDTTVFYNLWHISRCTLDGTPLQEAADFKPERFLSPNADRLPNPPEYLFGFGRRPSELPFDQECPTSSGVGVTLLKLDIMSKLQHRGFEACISCDDDDLPVHRPSAAGDTASGWIASTPGQAFKITVTQIKPETHFTLRLHLDGKRVEYLVTPNWQLRTLSTAGARPSPSTFTPFVFAAPSLSPALDSDSDEDEAEVPDEATLREIGTIRLEVTRVVLGAVYKTDLTQTGDLSPADVARKRGLGQHHIALGDERPGPPWIMRKWSVRPVDPRKTGPTVVFEFRYRPREFLLANGIIPRLKRAREARLDESPADQPGAKVARLEAEDATESTHSSDITPTTVARSTEDTNRSEPCDAHGSTSDVTPLYTIQPTDPPPITLAGTFNDPVPS
ncbi:cytochrome P450 [Auricularia subglabra TFB-10046 SS5]|nr:cytochrome P450 [Auricularia subglabra TFB-10046 SS5]